MTDLHHTLYQMTIVSTTLHIMLASGKIELDRLESATEIIEECATDMREAVNTLKKSPREADTQ